MALRRVISVGASEDRLEKLIQKRLKPDVNKELIDKRIWDLFGEVWCVMFTDLAAFSRKVATYGIIHFLQTIYESQRLLVPIIEEYDGILLKTEGDSMLVIFRNIVKGLECCKTMHQVLYDYNNNKHEEDHIVLCVGLGFGTMLRIGDEDVYGAEVNAASKLGEDIAEAWEVLVTNSVKENANNISNITFEPIDFIPPGAQSAYKVIFK
ncbi:MAG TPA: adenylate/guanylate cyclase domain-containing protein [Spirochaetota bacterium]|nr:adenylate/guanylate cyclase domain-containing protein [Spirochaetota bacterium]HPD04504.1 adenylate/guanylate cyclase domain-containing protein [Spirochaetota bacterium]HRR59963.1 adenylate/guanylate cyclase domain-containing protein [Spirochaetota bacterium]HRV14472.1 adenylate/guanylate cyclase domain-containing protein [Spirochaetota bacterium]